MTPLSEMLEFERKLPKVGTSVTDKESHWCRGILEGKEIE